MVITRYSVSLTSFRSLVVLSRPLGTSEGSIFSSDFASLRNLHSLTDKGTCNLSIFVDLLLLTWVVMSIINRYSHVPSTLSRAYWSLVNLCLLERNKEFVIESRGIEKIVKSMKDFPEDEELQFRACFVLTNLCSSQSSKNLVRLLGGIPFLLKILENSQNDNIRLRCACNLIACLCWSNPENARVVRSHGASTDIANIKEKFPQDNQLQLVAESALISLRIME